MSGFTAPQIEWVYLTPLLVVLGAGVVGVLIEAFVPARVRRDVQVVLTIAALLGALVAEVFLWNRPEVTAQRDVQLPLGQGSLPLPFGFARGVDVVHPVNGTGIGSGTYVADPFGIAAQVIVLVLAIVAVLVIASKIRGQDAFAPAAAAVPGSPYEELARRKGLEQTEAFPLVLFAVGGMMVFSSTQNLLVMFVALEVLSLPLYVLTAMARRKRVLAQEASFKYFVLGAFASALFLFGSALVYGYSQSVDLGVVFRETFKNSFYGVPSALDQVEGIDAFRDTVTSFGPLLIVGVLLILVGLLFKVGAAPFHSWTPDVYQGAPTPVTGFMAACTKAAAFAALVRVLVMVSIPMTEELREHLWTALWIVAILTMLIGTVVAVAQTDMKRMLAYSSIAHAGFILVGVIGMAPNRFVESLVTPVVTEDGEAYVAAIDAASDAVTAPTAATLFYLLAYGLATVGAFAVVTLVRERAAVPGRVPASVGAGGEAVPGDTPIESGADDKVAVLGEATHLSQWAGLGKRSPWLAAAFALFLLSMAGIPLTAGFVAKFGAFRAAIEGGATVLAVIGVLASAIAVFFYARIIVLMFFTAPKDSEGQAGVVVARSTATAVAIGVCALGVILLGLFPSWVLDLADQAAKFGL